MVSGDDCVGDVIGVSDVEDSLYSNTGPKRASLTKVSHESWANQLLQLDIILKIWHILKKNISKC